MVVVGEGTNEGLAEDISEPALGCRCIPKRDKDDCGLVKNVGCCWEMEQREY